MPSVCTKPDKKASTEVETPVRQCLNVVEKKVRNLEKRKGKIESIRQKAATGTELNEDQKEAASKYDSVLQNLEFARELQKQFAAIMGDMEKQMKKQAKKESHERQQAEIRRIKELLSLQNLLDSLGAEDVRADFVGGSKGAVQLSESELDKLDELYKLISPTRDEDNVYAEQLSAASEHIVNFLDAREKEVIGTTYKDLKALVEKINECGYFEAKASATEETAEEPEETAEVEEEAPEAPVVQETPAAIEPEATQEPQDFPLQQQTESLPQPTASLDFGGDAAAATMLGQQLEAEPTVDAADADTFFSTQPFPQPRPFTEIVSSVQSNFTFLQDSELEQAKSGSQQQQTLDPAVMAAAAQIAPQSVTTQPPADLSFLSDNAAAAAASQYQPPELSESQSAAAGLQQFSQSAELPQQPTAPATSSSAASAFDSDPTSMYSGVGLPQSTGGQGQYESSQPSAAGGFGAADSAADPPQPIPMPGQFSSEPEQSTAAAAAAANTTRQQFAMNPNADIFQSMYSGEQQQQPAATGNGYPSQQSAGAAAAGADSRQQPQQQAWGSSAPDFQSQGYGGGQYGGRRGNQQGGPASGAGGYRGNQQGRNGAGPNNMNGYRGGNPRSAPGNQRGGNSRGGYNGGPNRGMQQQQGGAMRGPAGGSSGGGAYKGYPARNDYQPEGGYQGYNTSNAPGFMQPSQGGPRGGPRNSVPRSGRNGGNYGNRMPPQ